MCLSVYLGTTNPVTIPNAVQGQLGVEKADWTPPPLQSKSGHEFVYYLGAVNGGGKPLGCSCLLYEHITWTADGPMVVLDPTYPHDACPFEALRALCDEATLGGGLASIVCDDSAYLEQDCTVADYCTGGVVRLGLIARGSLLFSDAGGGFPWRVLQVIR
jgi:hypothetical protein